MKILVISDTHLTNRFEPAKYKFLKKIITSSDQVVINGDFWEGYMTTFDHFVESEWKKLFPLLLSKKTVYVFGNHDKKEYANEKAKRFSIKQTLLYTFKSGKRTFHAEHGDRIVPFNDRRFKRMPILLGSFLNRLEDLSVKLTGMRAIKMLYEKFNEEIKKKVARNLKPNEFLICGHTSCAQIDLKNHYLNSGWVKHGVGQYLTIEEGKIALHDERY